jgi:hypothetical protein
MLRYLSIGALMLSSATAMAEGPSYSYIQASYQEIDVDDVFNADGDGYGIAGSVAINDSWFVFAGYASSELEFAIDASVDLDQATIGGGWNSAISEKTDWFVTLAYIDLEASSGFVSADADGLGASVGVRSMLNPKLELYGSLGYSDLGDGGDGTAVAAGLWYTVGGRVALGLGAEVGSDITTYGVGIRLYFDN